MREKKRQTANFPVTNTSAFT